MSFSPLILVATSGTILAATSGTGKAADVMYIQLASLLFAKWNEPYNLIISWLQCQNQFFTIHDQISNCVYQELSLILSLFPFQSESCSEGYKVTNGPLTSLMCLHTCSLPLFHLPKVAYFK